MASKKPLVRDNNVTVLVMISNLDFGRCPLASSTPTALWPVLGKSALESLLINLADQGIKDVVLCLNKNISSLIQKINIDERLNLRFSEEDLPVGTAGCIRDAMANREDRLLLVFPGGLISPPSIDVMLDAHKEGSCDLTIMLNPKNNGYEEQTSGLYICNLGVLEHIPQDGYCDIKETLIPEMLSAGKSIHAAVLPERVGNFSNSREYVNAITNYLQSVSELNGDLKLYKNNRSQKIWTADNVEIEEEAKILGPVVILDGAHIANEAVILGPTIIGRNSDIDNNSVIVNSVLWNDVKVASNCRLTECVVDNNVKVQVNTIAQQRSLSSDTGTYLNCLTNITSGIVKDGINRISSVVKTGLNKINTALPDRISIKESSYLKLMAVFALVVIFFWSYSPEITKLWGVWLINDEYSSGLLVPFLAVYILWTRRKKIAECQLEPSLWGVPIFVVAQALRIFGLLFLFGSAERLSIVLSIVAIVLLLFGWQLLRKVATVLLFLLLMLPWPASFQTILTLPLQRWSTASAVFCLELMSFDVIREGNVIHIGNSTVAVAEACNGLRMITAFFVISGLVVLLVKRQWWEKFIVLLSSVPIAFMCNTVRLAVTAVFFTILEGEYWEKIFHDFGGYAMMPLALAVIVTELWLLTKLTVPPEEEKPIIITRRDKRKGPEIIS